MEKFRRHFMTVLGTGVYEECMYKTGEFSCQTSFVQMAILKYVMAEYQEGDRITVFATKDAESKNWAPDVKKPIARKNTVKRVRRRRFCRELRLGEKTYEVRLQIKSLGKPVVREALPEEKTRLGLRDLLRREFPQVKPNLVTIPVGKNKEELDDIFEIIYREFSEGETVYFDFTNGLRNLPIQALAVLNYAKVLKNVQVGGLYYGAFALEENKKEKLKNAQIIDMSSYSIIQDWTSAAEAFVKAGSGNQIYKLYQSRKNRIDVDEECKDILESLHDLTNCLETSRGELHLHDKETNKSKKSIACAYEKFQESYEHLDAKEGLPTSEKPLKRLFEYIYEDIKLFDQKIYKKEGEKELEYTAMGMSVVQWAINKNLIQQGFTALNETIISYVCELYGVTANDRRKRDAVREAIRTVGNKNSDMDWESEYSPDKREKWVQAWEEKEKRKGNNAIDPKTTEKIKKMLVEIPVKVLFLSNQVSGDRNTMNHFGVLKGKKHASYGMLKNNLVQWYSRMRKILEESHEINSNRKTVKI